MLSLMFLSVLAEWLTSAQNWALAIFGIGLVVFVHEAGHFMVAKKCGVRVEIFSLGFGPRLFGWIREDTDYRVSLVPIGGYVKMAGDNPGEALEGDDSELPAKSVSQRAAIYSAGVVMNFIFALVVLPLVLAAGVAFNNTSIGEVVPGSPAWQAGLRAGDEVVNINGNEVYDFNNIVAEVAIGDDSVEFEVRRGESLETVRVYPEFDEAAGYKVCGIAPRISLEFVKDGPAARAGMQKTDRVISIDGQALTSFADYERFVMDENRRSVELELEDVAGQRRTVSMTPKPASTTSRLVGIRRVVHTVGALRGAAERLPDFLKTDDEILELVTTAEQRPEVIQHIRNPAEFVTALQRATTTPGSLGLRVLRSGAEIIVKIPAELGPSITEDIALVSDPDSTLIQLIEGYPAQKAGLPDNCHIVKVDGTPVTSWSSIRDQIDKATRDQADNYPITLSCVAGNRQQTVSVIPRKEQLRTDYGLLPVIAKVSRKYAPMEAARVGCAYAVYMLKHVYVTLKKIFVRDVSPRNLSGIITIAYVSRSLAESGVASLFFFLSVLSLNLAFINLLPIPILDGGHLFFLLVEKIKGSPVSDRVMGYSQLVGLVMVLALLLYVTYNDLMRVLPP